jgi:hypothetical protein
MGFEGTEQHGSVFKFIVSGRVLSGTHARTIVSSSSYLGYLHIFMTLFLKQR